MTTLSGVGAANADEPPSTKIIGGEDADRYYPFMASFQSERDGDPDSHRCGGALVAANWVLTAAHCVVEAGEGSDPYKFKDLKSYHLRIGSNSRTWGGSVVKIKRAVVPPGYRWDDDRELGKDLALVEIDRRLHYRRPALSSRLPEPGTRIREVGWGYTANGQDDPTKLPVWLQQLDTKVIPAGTPECVAYEGDDSWGIRDGDICADNRDGWRGTCNGDSGSPLLTRAGYGWRIEGVVSRAVGPDCASTPTIYTSTAAFRGWIKSVTGVG